MGLERVFLVRGDTVSYCIIGWIVRYFLLYHIVLSAGSYRIVWIALYRRLNRMVSAGLDRILSYRLDQETLDFMRWRVNAWMGRMGRMD